MIHLPAHRTKGPNVVGASGPGQAGPFGRWPGPADEDEDEGRPSAATEETNR